MPYLSRIRINPLRSGAQPLLDNPHQAKIEVLHGLPDRGSSQQVLWRLDTLDRHHPHLLVLTQSRPDWSHIVERAGWPDADGEHCLVRDYTPLLDQLALGREFAFRLTANPVQNTKKPDRPSPGQEAAIGANTPAERRGFRTGHRTARHQLAWLLRRAEKAGFSIPAARTSDAPAPGMPPEGEPAPDVRLIARATRRFHKRPKNRSTNTTQESPATGMVTLTTATFEGHLRVTDPAALRSVLTGGLGPAKRYGCGLLTLAPLSEAGRNG